MSESNQYLTFKLGDELFAIQEANVREILKMPHVIRVPTAPDDMHGVVEIPIDIEVELSGSGEGGIDERAKMGLAEGGAGGGGFFLEDFYDSVRKLFFLRGLERLQLLFTNDKHGSVDTLRNALRAFHSLAEVELREGSRPKLCDGVGSGSRRRKPSQGLTNPAVGRSILHVLMGVSTTAPPALPPPSHWARANTPHSRIPGTLPR